LIKDQINSAAPARWNLAVELEFRWVDLQTWDLAQSFDSGFPLPIVIANCAFPHDST
jgi:hypothetical protein